MLTWEKVAQHTSYELCAVLFGVSVAAVALAYGCTPAQDATAAADIAALELPTQADCAYLSGAGPDVDLVCVGVEALEDVLVNALRAAGTAHVPAVVTDAGVNLPPAVIFVKVDGTRATNFMARVKAPRDAGGQ